MISFHDCLYRGAKPALDEILNYRIEATLNLESGSQVIGDSLPLVEAMALDAIGVKSYPHPLGGILPPTIEELKLGVKFLKKQKANGVKTLVHCEFGRDRTGMTVAAYRIIEQGWAPSAAAKECYATMHKIYLPWLIQLYRL